MTTNFLYAQAPNRKGNISKDPAKLSGGVTAMTRSMGGTSYSSPNQGAPKTGCDPTYGSGQKVTVSRPVAYNTRATNTGYMNRDRTNYLK